MDFRHIDAFRALMLTGTSTKAAAMLGLSQPGISRLIAELERSTQITLFNRDKGRLDPTAEAKAFFEEVERRYAGIEGLREFLLRLRSPAESVLRVGSVNTYSLGLFARMTAMFAALEPGTRIALSVSPSELVRDQVAAGAISLGFVTDSVDVSDLDASPFCKVDAICAIPAHHHLAALTEVRIGDLANEPFINFQVAAMVRWGIDKLFADAGVQPRVVAEVQYGTNICSMVKEGLGVGLVHPVNAYDFLGHPHIVFRKFAPSVTFQSLLIKPWVPASSPLLQRFVATSRAALETVLVEVAARLAP